MTILEQANQLESVIVAHRRYIHENAERGFDLPITRAYVMEQLTKMGYEPIELGGGITATVGGKKTGKVFMLRADMDALPIIEELDLPYKSKTEFMHACGHDFHTSMLLGAAQILKDNEDDINGTVKLMFQPAEELLTGAKEMIDAGILENPKVDAAAMIHVFTGAPLPTGSVMLPVAGTGAAAADWVDIEIKGVGSHGAMPENSVDPINVASHLHTALQEILAREISPSANASFTIGSLNSGHTGNVIPDTAIMTGTIRNFDEEVRVFIKKRIEEMSDHIAKAFRATATVRYYNSCPVLNIDEGLTDSVVESLTNLLGPEKAIDMSKAKMSGGGSEDFAYVAEQVPAVTVSLSAGSSHEGHVYPLHHPQVTFNENALTTGAAVYVTMALEWLKNNN